MQIVKNTYTREEVNAASLVYFKGDELAAKVFTDKYSLKNTVDDVMTLYEKTPDDMHKRLAKEFARIELKYPEPMEEEEIYQLLKDFKYIIPQGSPMTGIGNPYALGSISNCFVIGQNVDSYGGIIMADEQTAQLMKRRGGVGQDISYIRPAGAIASTTPLGENSGTTLYMDRFSNTSKEVSQDGRRGAEMLSIDIKHPDAEKFIDKKMTPGSVTGANVSVRITKAFMRALNDERDFFQVFPIHHDLESVQRIPSSEMEYNKLYTGKVIKGVATYYKKVDPKSIWDKIVYNAWKSAEPGILFWDTILEESPAAFYGLAWKELSTNPCGEIPLPAFDSCRLLLLNLYGYISNKYTKDAMFEDDLFIDHVAKAMRLMDDIVDLEIEKIDAILKDIKAKKFDKKFQRVELELWTKIKDMAVQGRRTGLGITGEADMMAALGIKYGTPEGTVFSEKLHQLLATTAYSASIELAEERGAFPLWNINDVEASDFLMRMFSDDNELMTDELRVKAAKFGRRNIAILTIAPAGSVSILSQTSSGVEPNFAAWYFRKKKITTETEWDFVDENGDKWVEFPVFHNPFIEWFAQQGPITFDEAKAYLEKRTEEELQELFIKSPYYGATAQDVDYVEKVRMQGQIQKWVDHSISVTVNMPEHVTVEIVDAVYRQAYESKCKGVTVYRDNSRGNVLSTTSVKNLTEKSDEIDYLEGVKRPTEMICDIHHTQSRDGEFVILVGKLANRPYEVFALPANKINTSLVCKVEGACTGKIVKIESGKYSLLVDDEVVIDSISDLMIETEQNETRTISALLRHRVDPVFIAEMLSKFATISSFRKALEKVILTYVEDGKLKCTECGSHSIIKTEGCKKCTNCGAAYCG